MAMTLLFMDGCSHYDAATITQKWDSGSATMSSTVRHGAGQSVLSPVLLRKNFIASSEVIVSAAFRLPSIAAEQLLVRIFDGTNNDEQLDLVVLTTGVVRVRRGTGSTLIGGVGPTVAVNTWYFFEFGLLLSGTVGTLDVRIWDGTSATVPLGTISTTGLDTTNTAATTADAVIFDGAGNFFSDFHLWSGTGYSVAGNFLGDVRIDTLWPQFAGANAQWTIGGSAPAASNHASQNETLADEGVTFVSEATTTQRDTYEFTELDPTVATVHAVQQLAQWRKDDTATRGARLSYRDTGGTYHDSSEFLLPADWIFGIRTPLVTNPSGGGAWTRAAVNDGQWGEILST